MNTTSLLELPYIMPAQAQKHVTHNEALRRLDALTQIGVNALALNLPPENPSEGQRVIVGPEPEGVFSGHARELAAFQEGAWAFFTPSTGWMAWDAGEGVLVVFDGEDWGPAAPHPQTLALLGINGSADETNRLAVSAPASLLNHEGEGHQLKINKADAADSATLLFQTDWSGRAELGLAGNDDFSIKVSSDGADWTDALVIDRITGRVGMGVSTPATQLDVNGVVRSETGFRIGEATLQNGANVYQLATSAHFSTSGLFAVGTTPVTGQSVRVRVAANTPDRYAFYSYADTMADPLLFVRGDGSAGLGTATPHESAVFEILATTRGFLPPRLTGTERDGIASPAEGLIIYNTTDHEPQFWNGSAWMGMG